MKDYVTLPFRPEDALPASDVINVVDMFNEQELSDEFGQNAVGDYEYWIMDERSFHNAQTE